jgi:L,D-peptidoglycan transpeptidase YkuD (ErfK/YbiS/YcfS/YnhG family)
VAAVVVVVGGTTAVVAMSSGSGTPSNSDTPFAMPTVGHSVYVAPTVHGLAPTPTSAHARTSASARHSTVPASTSAAPSTAPRSTRVAPPPPPAPKPTPKPAPTTRPVSSGQALPLGYSTGTATQVITVVASSTGNTVATLQAWNKAAGGGWVRYGGAVLAHIGADGMSTSPSESRSATPIGSYTLTQAFGYYGNPGTGLPYLRTNPSDWWISQSGPLYNTLQSCSGSCPFTQGDPNEHLYYETPYYNYAVVIDYNTRNAGPVRQGAGSAFFLHVTNGSPTAGCVAIDQGTLVTIMKWLTPAAHPRILIGVG